MNAEQSTETGRAIVLCLDGTANEPEAGVTNVARIFDVAVKDERQLAFYHPGVGTMGARGAFTAPGQALSRAAGLVAGFGIKGNIEQAYAYLMRTYQPADRIYVFGFSRGAYTARALTGMLRTVGLLRPGAENLVPYAVKLYTQAGKLERTRRQAAAGEGPASSLGLEQKKFWALRDDFTRCFGNPLFPSRFGKRKQVHFLGVWDTVKSVGWLNWRAQFQQARWPYTAKITNVNLARHALAIDERRRPYRPYRFDADVVAASGGLYQEMWFAGTHSDIGGQFADDHVLSDIAFTWILEEAAAAGFRFRPQVYRRMVGVKYAAVPGPDPVTATLHSNKWWWILAGGWRHRVILPGDAVHPTVETRVAGTKDEPRPYRVRLPDTDASSRTR
jgi:uncharacterized protein (DUF2235 family)